MVSYHITWCYRFTLVPGIIDVYLFHGSYGAILKLKDIGQRTENKFVRAGRSYGTTKGRERRTRERGSMCVRDRPVTVIGR